MSKDGSTFSLRNNAVTLANSGCFYKFDKLSLPMLLAADVVSHSEKAWRNSKFFAMTSPYIKSESDSILIRRCRIDFYQFINKRRGP